jgi:hypothetical protein
VVFDDVEDEDIPLATAPSSRVTSRASSPNGAARGRSAAEVEIEKLKSQLEIARLQAELARMGAPTSGSVAVVAMKK